MESYLLGVVSDTHGLVLPSVLDALQDVDLIVHAGDVGDASVLARLGEIAPMAAVRGNVDWGAGVCDLPTTEVVEVGGALLYVLHNLNCLDLLPEAAGFSAVVSGHTHQPTIEREKGVLFLNPGSAGPPPVSIARLRVHRGSLDARILALE